MTGGRALKVFGWMADQAGCGYYRIACPLWGLQDYGYDTTWSEVMADEVPDEADIIVGQRVVTRAASAHWQSLAREGRALLVYEIDDDLLHVDPANRHAYGYFAQGFEHVAIQDSLREVRFRSIVDTDRRQRLIDNITVADLVTVSTAPLAEVVAEYNPNVVVLPNCVPERFLDHERIHREDVTVGWRGGSSHSRDFGELAKPLRGFLQAHPEVEFHSIGADYTDRVTSRRGRVRHTGWLAGTEEFIRAVDFDLAVIPLRPSQFNDCKSDLALLEMAALGIPVITSDTGPYRRAVDEGAPALLAATPRDWTAHLVTLTGDPVARVELGARAREWATSRTVQGNTHLWLEAYERALTGRIAA